MRFLSIRNKLIQKHYKDPDALGLFMENQDMVRLMCMNKNLMLYKSSLIFLMTFRGIPILYYGSEQGFYGCEDPENRETMFEHFN